MRQASYERKRESRPVKWYSDNATVILIQEVLLWIYNGSVNNSKQGELSFGWSNLDKENRILYHEDGQTFTNAAFM